MAGAAGALLAVLLVLPWSITWWTQWESFARPRQSPVGAATASDLLRFATGTVGSSPLSWGLLVSASLALLIGRDWRLVWAIRGWFVALVCWGLAFAGVQGWLPVPLPPLEVLLAPAAAGLVLALSMGVAAFETDLRDFHFGWRQLVSVVAGIAFVLGTLPALGAAVVDGRWGSPVRGLDQTISFIEGERAAADFRVLWLGDPEVLPLSGWTYDDAVTYQVTSTGLPAVRDLFPGAVDDDGAALLAALHAAAAGDTARLGQLLSTWEVRYLVLPIQVTPSDGSSVVPRSPLIEALPEQLDLAEIDVSSAVRVWENAAWTEGVVPSEPTTSSSRTVLTALGLAAWLMVLVMAMRTKGAR